MTSPDAHAARHDARIMPFDGIVNFRDFGGLRTRDGGVTRHGLLFRSDSLGDVTPADLARLAELRVETLFDLRGDWERKKKPNLVPGDRPRQIVHGFLPQETFDMVAAINAGRWGRREAYENMLLQYRRLAMNHLEAFRRLFDDLFAHDFESALLIHCTSGKDRTGIAAAALQIAVDVEPEDIMADYALSNRHRRHVSYFDDQADPEAISEMLAARPEFLDSAFAAACERFGSLARYIEDGMGITPERRRRLRAVLVAS